MVFPWILLEPLQWKVLETRTALGSSAILRKPVLWHAECCAGWWGRSLLPPHPSTSFPWKRWGAKTREQALGLWMGRCSCSLASSVGFREARVTPWPNPALTHAQGAPPAWPCSAGLLPKQQAHCFSWTHLPAAAHDLPEIALLLYSRL